jgi:hypothetical protein
MTDESLQPTIDEAINAAIAPKTSDLRLFVNLNDIISRKTGDNMRVMILSLGSGC